MANATIIKPSFFARPTAEVAYDLLGKYLVRRYRSRAIASMITDVEIYDGVRDKGSHAHRGMTKRNAPMFGPPGYWYVYFTYGVHWMLNVVTHQKDYPAAILIRGTQDISGPARLTKKFNINGNLNNKRATRKSGLWVEDRGVVIDSRKIKKGPRIGIDYAGPFWAKRRWRFSIDSLLQVRNRIEKS